MPVPARLRRIVPVLLVAAVAVGCGNDDDTLTEAETTAAETTTTEETSADTTRPAGTTTETTDGSDTTSPATAEGVTYTSPEGDYSVVFPEEPTTSVQDAPLPDGQTVALTIVGVELDDAFSATSRGQYPAGYVITDIPGALQGAEDQALANVNGTLESSRDITLQGRPGREFSASVESGGTSGTLLARVYLDDTTIYQVLHTGEGEISFTDPDVAAFFESFRFTSG